MILDFRYRDYVCKYYAGAHRYNVICFSNGCDRGRVGNYSYITYIFPKNKQNELNYCFLNKTDLLGYFVEISKIFGFKLLSFKETEDLYKLQIRCICDNRYFIYISTYIRYVYEWPFSLLLAAAWKNKNNFPELNITHIMQFYLAVFFDGRRCHCPGEVYLAFQNINPKCQFNLLKRDFNRSNSFIQIKSKYEKLTSQINQFNLKQLPQIISGINFIANKCYERNKKNICRW